MKKAISILLVLVMSLSMCGCAGGSKSGEIKLTLDNYEQYLKFNACYVDTGSKNVSVGHWGVISRPYKLIANLNVQGTSTNFNYNDIKITILCSGSYGTTTLASVSGDADEGSYKTFNQTVVLTTDISGAGRLYPDLVTAPGGKAIVDVVSECKVIGISGTVTPA